MKITETKLLTTLLLLEWLSRTQTTANVEEKELSYTVGGNVN
jgi:hypothetical protein